MSVAARLNSRITQLAVGRHLPHRTVRVRLTLLYGGLFLLSGAALMAITYVLLSTATYSPSTPAEHRWRCGYRAAAAASAARVLPSSARDQYPSTQDQQWRGSQCAPAGRFPIR